jgi:hypothetical protein
MAADDTVAGVGEAVTKTAARGREEADDIWAEARAVADRGSLAGSRRDATVYLGLTGTAVAALVELPAAGAANAESAIVPGATGSGSTP